MQVKSIGVTRNGVAVALMLLCLVSSSKVWAAAHRPEYLADEDVASIVLSGSRLSDLQKRWTRLRYLDETEFDLYATPIVFEYLVRHPTSNRAWEAVYHYKSMTDAGASLVLSWSCFDLLLDHGILLRDRFASGDERALIVLKWALFSDSSRRYPGLYNAAVKKGHKDFAAMYRAIIGRLNSGFSSNPRLRKRESKFASIALEEFRASHPRLFKEAYD